MADIGSGTGKLSELFLSCGNTVFVVEPNADMRMEAEALLAESARFRSVDGLAFHWFEPDRARAEFRRILSPSGSVLLVWNVRETEATPFLRAYEEFLREFSPDYGEVHHGRLTESDAVRIFFSEDHRLATIPRAMERLAELFHAYQEGGCVAAPLRTVVHTGRV